MTESFSFSTVPASASSASVPETSPTALASQLSAKLCHDFISPVSAIASGLDLLEDPASAEYRQEAMNMITSSGRRLGALLAFARVAFGSSSGAESFDARELERLARGLYQHVRPDMVWQVEPATLSKGPARILLNFAQLAADMVSSGGVVTLNARVQDGEALVSAGCEATRVRLKPEVETGLRGEPLQSGLGGAWIQAFFTHELARAAGGRLELSRGETRATLSARLPA